jgi:hypothetical protein
MLFYQAWEIKQGKIERPSKNKNFLPALYFRQIEKIMLYWTKRGIQWLILVTVKYWTILVEENKKIINKKFPQIKTFFKKLKQRRNHGDFIHRAMIESRFKIKRVREKVKKEYQDIVD